MKFLCVVLVAAVCALESEYGFYVNPNPRASLQCSPEDMARLAACAAEVLLRLEECVPDDLACECCALQSMQQECFGLCAGLLHASDLAVLYDDCELLNDVNACGLPFRKETPGGRAVGRPRVSRVVAEEVGSGVFLKSKVGSVDHESGPEPAVLVLHTAVASRGVVRAAASAARPAASAAWSAALAARPATNGSAAGAANVTVGAGECESEASFRTLCVGLLSACVLAVVL